MLKKDDMAMQSEIAQEVDRISEVLVHTIGFDQKTMADLSDWFEKLSESALRDARPGTAVVTGATAIVLEKMAADDNVGRLSENGPRKTRWFWSNEAGRTKADYKYIIKMLLIDELQNTGCFCADDIQ